MNKVEISKSFNSSDVLSVIFILPVFLAVPPSFLIAILLLEFSIVPNPNAIVPLFVAVPLLIEIPVPLTVPSFNVIVPSFVKVVVTPSTFTPIAFSPETVMLPSFVFVPIAPFKREIPVFPIIVALFIKVLLLNSTVVSFDCIFPFKVISLPFLAFIKVSFEDKK